MRIERRVCIREISEKKIQEKRSYYKYCLSNAIHLDFHHPAAFRGRLFEELKHLFKNRASTP